MPRTRTLAATALLAVMLAACHHDRMTGPAVFDVNGTWWAHFNLSDTTADSANLRLLGDAVGGVAGTGTLSALDSTGAVTFSGPVEVLGRVDDTRIVLVLESAPDSTPADTMLIIPLFHTFDGTVAGDSLSGTYTIPAFSIPPFIDIPGVSVPAVFHRVP
ncbi:MAG TPA: hypothetical protein VFK13_15515 [Gemmatimonadaceae bacterium]|nr:hypothetical protein [Gemmatimonadaceae bacterium]